MANAISDIKHALRRCRRSPQSTFLAIVILALGIGVNTAVFSIVNPLLLRPLPFRDADRLVWISPAHRQGRALGHYSVSVFEELKRNSGSFAELTAYHALFRSAPFALTRPGPAEELTGVWVAPRFFELLDVQPIAGRLFSAEESRPNGPAVALISYRLWQRRFSADRALIGTSITVNNDSVTVVGVLPPDFEFGSVFAPGAQVDIFAPAPLEAMRAWGNSLSLVGRLKDGVSLPEVRAEVETVIAQLRNQHPEWGPTGAVVTDLRTHVNGAFRRPLVVLWSAVGVVLLIVCLNISSLLLARTMERTREIGIRLALGASRARVFCQLVTEGVVLGLAGATAGIPLAYGITRYVKTSSMNTVPLLHRVEVDGPALLLTAALAVVAGIAVMAIPAARVSTRPPSSILQDQTRESSDSRALKSIRSALVGIEVALACVLLVGAGLLTRSLLRVLDVDLGFRPASAYAIRLNLTALWVAGAGNRDGMNARIHELTEAVRALPGIEAAGVTDALPLDRGRRWTVSVPGQVLRTNQKPAAAVYVIGPGYLPAMRIPLREGREFSPQDMARGGVIIVNETLAQRLWPGMNALGRTVRPDWPGTFTVVGVVADVRQTTLEEPSAPQMYLPYTHVPPGAPDLILRSTLPPAAIASSLRNTLSSGGELMFSELRPLEDLVDRAIAPRRFLAEMIGGFSVVALVLGCLGIYSVVSYNVSRNVRDIGVRMALGASRHDIHKEVVGEMLPVAAGGTIVGIVVAFWIAKLISAALYNTSPSDPGIFAGTALVLMIAALIAAYVPALRAARLDPTSALRAE